MARFLASVSPGIPWHITAFHADYKMRHTADTPAESIAWAVSAGRRAGLRFVYGGNLRSHSGDLSNTCCPHCHAVLVERWGYRILRNRLDSGRLCLDCGGEVPGIWRRAGQGATP